MSDTEGIVRDIELPLEHPEATRCSRGRRVGHEPGQRLAGLGDDYLLAGCGLFYQAGQMGFRLVEDDGLHARGSLDD